eukprot:IDg13055t1
MVVELRSGSLTSLKITWITCIMISACADQPSQSSMKKKYLQRDTNFIRLLRRVVAWQSGVFAEVKLVLVSLSLGAQCSAKRRRGWPDRARKENTNNNNNKRKRERKEEDGLPLGHSVEGASP